MPRNCAQPASAADPTPRPACRPDRLLKLAEPGVGLLGRALGGRAVAPLERIVGLDQLNALYDDVVARPLPAGADGVREFLGRVLDGMSVSHFVSPEDLARIPKAGPFVAVANHPFGGLDGILLAAVLAEVRPDVKVMANHLLGRVPELRDLFVLVDPFGGPAAAARNAGPMRQSLRWLRDGHALAAFPAGEVAHLTWGQLGGGPGEDAVTDPAWSPTVARLAMRAGVPVLPIFFEGWNGPLFQAAGLLHPLLRTALLPRAFLGQRGARVTIRIGSVVPAKRVAGFETEAALTDYLRRRTFLLRHGAPRPSIPATVANAVDAVIPVGTGIEGNRVVGSPAALPRVDSVEHGSAPRGPAVRPLSGGSSSRSSLGRAVGMLRTIASWHPFARSGSGAPTVEPVIDPVDPALLVADVAALPPDALLLDHDGMAVYHARAPQLRHVLREIGRLREATFRQVGEGTGRAIDLDTFDYDYSHLFIWNRAAREIVGAYRLGRTDELLPAKGRGGLYTSTLFNYQADLLRRLSPALEMGRSFVRAEYQRSYAPLLLLWKGIGHFLVRHPKYRYLFGPVSISNSYSVASRQLMVDFLRLRHAMPEGEALARPKNPFKPSRALRLGTGDWDAVGVRRLLADDDEVSGLVADLEPDQKGIPVLVRQYLKLGAKFVSFNVDRAFGDCLDGLIVVDLLGTEARVLERYMTKDGYAGFVAHHKEPVPVYSDGENLPRRHGGTEVAAT